MGRYIKYILSYLLSDDRDVEDKSAVIREIKAKLPDDNEVVKLAKVFEKFIEKYGETPGFDHLVDEYDLDISRPDEDPKDLVETFDLIEKLRLEEAKYEISEATNEALDDDDVDANTYLNTLRSKIDRYEVSTSEERLSLRERYEEQKNQSRGLRTFVGPVDDCIQSLEIGTTSVLAGQGGHLKTSTALSTIYGNVTKLKYNIVVVSAEMSPGLLEYGLLSRHSANEKFSDILDHPFEVRTLQNTELDEDDEEAAFQVWDDFKENDDYGELEILMPDDFESLSVSGMRSKFSKMDFEVDAVFVDFIQKLKYIQPDFNPRDLNLVNYYVNQFVDLTEDIDGTGKKCHVQLLSQTNRQGQERAEARGGKYDNRALSEAHSLDRLASYIYFMYAPDKLLETNQAKVILTKNRYGESMTDPAVIPVDPSINNVDCEQMDHTDTDDVAFEDIL